MPEHPKMLQQVMASRNHPSLADLVVLCPPTNGRLLEVHVVPTERQDGT